MSVFIGEKGKRVELAERKDATNPNLLTNSKDWTTNIAVYGSTKILDQRYLGGKIVSLTGTGVGNSVQITNLSLGDQVAWSCYAKSNGSAVLHTEANGGGGSKNINLSNDWTRISSHGAARGNGTLFFWNTTPNSKIDLCLPKIEKGAVATPWCPAIEDYAMKSDTDSAFADVRNRLGKLEGTQTLDSPDFNTVTASGVYFITSNAGNMKNSPTVAWGTLVVSSGNNARIVQVYYPDNGSAPWYRMKVDQTWQDWRQLGTKADVNAINNKVNVDAPLFHQITKNDTWENITGITNDNKKVLVAFRDNNPKDNDGHTTGDFGAGVVFGGGDTKGVLSVDCFSHKARIAGGNGTAPTWHEDIAWKSDLGNYAIKSELTNPNYLLGSKGFDGWSVRNADATNDSYNGGKVISVHAGGDGSSAVSIVPQPTVSQTVTWSVYAKATNDGDRLHTELFGGGGLTEQPLTTDWRRYTFTGAFSPTKRTLYFWGVGGNKGDVQIALPKLEIGTVATPWCPAIEDYALKSDLGTKLISDVNADINTLTTEGKFFVKTNNFDHFPADYRNAWYFLEVVVSEITTSLKRIKQTVTPDNTDTAGWTMTRTGVTDNGETINWKSWLITDYANGKVLKG